MPKLHILLFCMTYTLFAQNVFPQISCFDLDTLADSLDDMADELSEIDTIGIDGELDIALGEMTNVLYQVAQYENDYELNASTDALEQAWQYAQLDAFENAIEDIIDRLDDLDDRDCD